MAPALSRILVRLVGMVLTLLVASLIIYAALYIMPGDPAATIAGGGRVTPETLAAIKDQYHLDDPFLVRYWAWLGSAVQGDFGQSFVYKDDIGALLAPRIVNTAYLVVYSAIIIILAGTILGVLGSVRGRAAAGFVTITTAIGQAIPIFVAAIILIAVFAVSLGWFPTFGAGSGFLDRLWHLTLPAIALSLSFLAWTAQVTRDAVNNEKGREHVLTARSRGLSEKRIVWRHILRNAAGPITTVSGLTIAGLVAGAVIAETAFQVSGLGAFLVEAVEKQDIAVVQAIVLILVAAFVVTNTAADALNTMLDPRLRKGRR